MLTQTRSDPQTRRIPLPDLGRVSHAAVSGATPAPAPERPLPIRHGRPLRGLFDPLIAGSSLVPNDPVLDMRDFTWTCELRRHWRAIRDEAAAVALERGAAPGLFDRGPDHRAGAAPDSWRSLLLHGHGDPITENIARCPATAAALAGIPGLVSAFFSVLAPGTHIPSHRGVTKALVTCHLGLIVPQGGDVRMRVGDRVVRWAEGETLVFDDTHDHEVWNDSAGTRVVLSLQFRRPLAQPGRWIADRILAGVGPLPAADGGTRA